jgi:hypothetical protein
MHSPTLSKAGLAAITFHRMQAAVARRARLVHRPHPSHQRPQCARQRLQPATTPWAVHHIPSRPCMWGRFLKAHRRATLPLALVMRSACLAWQHTCCCGMKDQVLDTPQATSQKQHQCDRNMGVTEGGTGHCPARAEPPPSHFTRPPPPPPPTHAAQGQLQPWKAWVSSSSDFTPDMVPEDRTPVHYHVHGPACSPQPARPQTTADVGGTAAPFTACRWTPQLEADMLLSGLTDWCLAAAAWRRQQCCMPHGRARLHVESGGPPGTCHAAPAVTHMEPSSCLTLPWSASGACSGLPEAAIHHMSRPARWSGHHLKAGTRGSPP